MNSERGSAPVLLVDDSSDDLALVGRILTQCKILNPVIPLRSADKCIEYFQRLSNNREMSLPVLVLLDLNMQPGSGLQVLQYLNADRVAEKVAVVMLSGMRDIKIIQEGYRLGARTFLVKPITQEDVIAMLSSIRTINIEEKPYGYVLSPVGDEIVDEKGDTSIFRKRPASFAM